MPRWKASLAKIPSLIRRYGLAILSVAIALGTALVLAGYGFLNVAQPLFLLAIAITVWYAGPGPAVLAFVAATLADDYFFIQPRYSFYIERAEIPHVVIFILIALLLTWFSAIRRRIERELRQSRDELEREVEVRTQQASLLNLTHDTIFVRDMSDIITYWNRGAEELYGGGRNRQWESALTIFCGPSFRRRSTTSRLSCCKRDGGRVNSST